MKFSKSLYLGFLALALALTGCSSTDDDAANKTIGGNGTNGLPPGGFSDPNGLNGSQWNKNGTGLGAASDDWERIPKSVVNFPTIYFAFNKYDLSAADKADLDKVGAYLTQNAGINLIIEGNCDERGSAEYNRGLGEKRALAAKEYLMSKGIADSRFKTISYGSERPAVEGHNEAAWSKNRRDDLIAAKPRN